MNDVAARAAEVAKHSHCEAKKDRLVQNQDGGWKVTFAVMDLPRHVIAAPMGTRYVLALVEINDDEEPVEHSATDASERGKAAYARMTEGEQATTRSVFLCREPEFQGWAKCKDETEAATFIRRSCHINTRSAFATNTKALEVFLSIERQFKDSLRYGEVR